MMPKSTDTDLCWLVGTCRHRLPPCLPSPRLLHSTRAHPLHPVLLLKCQCSSLQARHLHAVHRVRTFCAASVHRPSLRRFNARLRPHVAASSLRRRLDSVSTVSACRLAWMSLLRLRLRFSRLSARLRLKMADQMPVRFIPRSWLELRLSSRVMPSKRKPSSSCCALV